MKTLKTLLIPACFGIFFLTTNVAVYGQTLLDSRLEAGPEIQTVTGIYTIPVPAESLVSRIIFSITSELEHGKGDFHISSPQDTTLHKLGWGKALTMSSRLKTNGMPGDYVVHATLTNAIGFADLHLEETPFSLSENVYSLTTVSGLLMILIGFGFVIYWKMKTHLSLKWFWIGAGVWTIGVALKFLYAIPTNTFVLTFLNESLPEWLYMVVGSVYIGSLTGIFEIGITLLIALKWRSMTQSPGHAVAVGIGAGAFEAILLGMAVLVGAALVGTTATYGMFLVGPTERFMTIFFHIASRVLTLQAIHTGKYKYFWWGFALLTAVDSIAGWVHLGSLMEHMSIWGIEAMLFPFVPLSIFIIYWSSRNWSSHHQV